MRQRKRPRQPKNRNKIATSDKIALVTLLLAAMNSCVVNFVALDTFVRNDPKNGLLAELLSDKKSQMAIKSYAKGPDSVIFEIPSAKHHTEDPISKPLGPAIGKLVSQYASLASPAIVAMLTTMDNKVADQYLQITGF